MQTVPANQHDGATMLPLVLDMPEVAGKVGRPKRKPAMVVADKAFDDEALRTLLRWLESSPCYPNAEPMNMAWASGAGLSNAPSTGSISFDAYESRWDRRPEIHQAFLILAAAVICYRLWESGT